MLVTILILVPTFMVCWWIFSRTTISPLSHQDWNPVARFKLTDVSYDAKWPTGLGWHGKVTLKGTDIRIGLPGYSSFNTSVYSAKEDCVDRYNSQKRAAKLEKKNSKTARKYSNKG